MVVTDPSHEDACKVCDQVVGTSTSTNDFDYWVSLGVVHLDWQLQMTKITNLSFKSRCKCYEGLK